MEHNTQPLIIHGQAGVGKSHWIQNYAKENKMILHICRCRKDRTLREGRERLHTLAKRYETSIIWLEERDDLTQEAQAFLRRILETHTSTILFILECRDTRKLQEAIRSRCRNKYVHPPSKSEIAQYFQRNNRKTTDITCDQFVEYITGNMDISWRQVCNVMKLVNESPELWEEIWNGYRESMEVPLSSDHVIDYINAGIDPNILLRRLLGGLSGDKLIDTMEKYGKMLENNGSIWSFLAGDL